MCWSRGIAAAAAAFLAGCNAFGTGAPAPTEAELASQGKTVFRHDTFGDETFWTDTLRMHEAIAGGVSPKTALSVGLKVDLDTLPQSVRDAIKNGQV
ncbi:MAG TPA: hypothetical protein VHM30_09135, partial [Gemmatimonadaceae bacterium]|nr:hypothetical protein [Gemmatimonadaceae bacterium]